VLKPALVNVYNAPSSPNILWTIYHLEDDRIILKKLYELVQDELEAIDGIEVTKSCFKRFLIHSSNNGNEPHTILLEWRTGNRKFIWSGLRYPLCGY